MENHYNLTEVLDHINPAELDYSEWCAVGMALEQDARMAAGAIGQVVNKCQG